MMASLRAKSARGKRSGDGREGRSSRLERAASIPGRATGEGMQAKAWSSTSFEKLKGGGGGTKDKDANNCSSSTSPETDPGASNLFPFFTEEEDDRGEQDAEEGRDGHNGAAVEARQGSWQPSEKKAGGGGGGGGGGAVVAAKGKARPKASASAGKLEHRNPMFHAANVNAEEAVASLFPGEECEESTRSAMNGSNPMFKRNISEDGRPRPKSKRPDAGADAKGGGGSSTAKEPNDKEKDKDKEKEKDKPKKKKKEKAMYEHVGRMNVRPFLDGGGGGGDGEDAAESGKGSEHGGAGIGHGAFRMDTFARNEGDGGGKAHFKFVFTLDGVVVPTEGEDAKKLRPVLDAIHERSTGNLRVRVNDGREITATATGASPSAVDVALANIGVVLFYPKTVSKGHHLYTLSLNGRTLFSVLA